MPTLSRGEVWRVRFDPTEGAEIRKARPSVVMSVKEVGVLPLRIIVPITEWKEAFAERPWLVRLALTVGAGLRKESAADAFQIKSLSIDRFEERLGVLTEQDIEEIAAAIVLCVGYI